MPKVTEQYRDARRGQILDAARRCFLRDGFHETSMHDLFAEVGLSSGAVYRYFASKDELIIAMLEDHVEQSIQRCLDLLAKHKKPEDFIDAFRNLDRTRQDPLGRSPLLHMEMILFVARAEKRRPELAKRLRARRQMMTEIVDTTATHSGRNFPNPAWVGAILLALEDGFRLHRLIDPDTTPGDSFVRAIGDLQQAIGVAFDAP